MGAFKWIVITSLVVVFLSIYFQSDSDLLLRFSPEYPADGYSGKVIWITGASSGIGAALAHTLTKAGAQVIISARRANQLEDVANSCAEVGKKPYVLPLDVTDLDAQKLAYDNIVEKFGVVDTLVLNAGRSQRSSALDTPLKDTFDLFHLNVFSFISLTQVVLPSMIERKGGQIVVVSSILGKIGVAGISSYASTKFALHGYFDSLRQEIGQHNISVVVACPGPVESEISQHLIRGSKPPVNLEHDKKEKRMSAERCAYLMAKAMFTNIAEPVISEQPIIFLLDLAEQFPWVMRHIAVKVIGPNRLKAIESGGLMYDMKKNLGL